MIDPRLALLVFAGLVAVLAMVFWPRHGLVPRLWRLTHRDERVLLEDALKHVFTCRRNGQTCSLESTAGRLEVSTARAGALLSRLAEAGMILMGAHGPTLTDQGERLALRIVRTHRLWERYLADHTGIPPGEWHDEAERMEHALSPEQTNALAARLGDPTFDPHGDPIPSAAGELPPLRGMGLLDASPGRVVEIVHLEDEPPAVYHGLVAGGLAVGGRLQVVARTDRAVTVRDGGREWTMDPVAAHNVTVRYPPAGAADQPTGPTLADAGLQQAMRVRGISQACQGAQRRRLLDLGVVRGAEIVPELASATGDPVAYRIRGALVALRREQAAWIEVEPAESRREDIA
ncbi:MAG: iron dependent repressor, metal binding and dimerization domain protein [Vicinamibacterales bacterium]